MVCPQCGTLNENAGETCIRCKRRLHPESMKGKIACSVHANREATTSCALCGTRLCEQCAVSANGIDYCENCAPADATRQAYDEDYEKLQVVDPNTVPVANFDSRFFALLIDAGAVALCIGILAIALWLITGGALDWLRPMKQPTAAYWVFRLMILFGLPLYLFAPVAMTGQTLGMRLSRIIALQPDGNIITIRMALFKTLAQIVSLVCLGFGFWWMIWDPDKETWDDKFSGTKVFEFTDTV